MRAGGAVLPQLLDPPKPCEVLLLIRLTDEEPLRARSPGFQGVKRS